MSTKLDVLIDDKIAGELTRLKGGKLRLDYDSEYRQQTSPTPLSVSMPTQVRSHADHLITPWLWGLLPDNGAVLAPPMKRSGDSSTRLRGIG